MGEVITVSALGAIVGLSLAIVFIFMKIPVVYSLMLGALIGGTVGGVTVDESIKIITGGAAGMMTTVLRILAAGVLAGTLIHSGAADRIAITIVRVLGEKRALLALALSALVLTAVGVFIDIAVITVSPIALALAKRTGFTKTGILIAMIGGGKAGNMISPNPNAIAAASSFNVPLTSVMASGILPAAVALVVTSFIAMCIRKKGSYVSAEEIEVKTNVDNLPCFAKAVIAPIVAILCLALRPVAGIKIDPMLALPLGGVIGAFAMGKGKKLFGYAKEGLASMSNVAIILIGTGAIAGVIQNSNLGALIISSVKTLGLPLYFLAPIAGILMSGATASTTSGTTVASEVFGRTLTDGGLSPVAGASMIHTGATVLDHLPHGSFFHATAGSVHMEFKERLALVAFESIIGLSMTVTSLILFGVFGIA